MREGRREVGTHPVSRAELRTQRLSAPQPQLHTHPNALSGLDQCFSAEGLNLGPRDGWKF